jgi:hypothetical protein
VLHYVDAFTVDEYNIHSTSYLLIQLSVTSELLEHNLEFQNYASLHFDSMLSDRKVVAI